MQGLLLRRLWVILSFTLICPNLFGEDVSIQYVVHIGKADAIFKSASKNYGHKNRHQPVQNTKELTAPNTNYYRLFVTPRNQIETNILKIKEADGTLLKISETRIVRVNGQKGDEIKAQTTEFNSLPADFYRDWIVVEISSQ